MMLISQALKVSDRAMKQAKDPRASIAPDPIDFKRFSVDHI
jgi:hypothetical protein